MKLLFFKYGTLFSLIFLQSLFSFTKVAENVLALSPLRCPLYFLTHHICPTCGLGRSLVYAFSSQIELSIQYHFLGILLWLGAWMLSISAAINLEKTLALLKVEIVFLRPRKSFWLVVGLYCVWGFTRKATF